MVYIHIRWIVSCDPQCIMSIILTHCPIGAVELRGRTWVWPASSNSWMQDPPTLGMWIWIYPHHPPFLALPSSFLSSKWSSFIFWSAIETPILIVKLNYYTRVNSWRARRANGIMHLWILTPLSSLPLMISLASFHSSRTSLGGLSHFTLVSVPWTCCVERAQFQSRL